MIREAAGSRLRQVVAVDYVNCVFFVVGRAALAALVSDPLAAKAALAAAALVSFRRRCLVEKNESEKKNT